MQLEVGDIYDAGGINKRDIYAITIFTTNDGQTVMNNPGYSSGQSTPDFPESPNAGEQPSWANSRCHSTWALSEENCGFDAFDDAGNYLIMDWMSMGPWDLQSDSMIGMDFIIDFMGADGYAFACCSELYATVSGDINDCPSGYYDCAGECDGTAVEDCNGDCNGSALNDDCGVCNGDSSSCADCAGVPNGTHWSWDACRVRA